MFLQVVGNSKELLSICTQILACVSSTDPALVLQLQQLNFQLRWTLAEVALEASVLKQRISSVITRLQ